MATDEPTTRPNAIAKLEELTCRRIGIDCKEIEAEGKYNNQLTSPLFSVLPQELRDLIWAYATAPFEDPNAKFEETAYYYRPGHTARLRTDTALLRTCRRIWLEANPLPMLQAEHSFYYDRAAPDKRDPQWTAHLTAHNRQNFGLLHLFVQMCNIEGLTAAPEQLRAYFLKTVPAVPGDFQPRVFHMTLRHTDWWYWEREAPLDLKDVWVSAMLNSPDLRSTHVFKLELETLDYKVDQLIPIVERIKNLPSEEMETHIVDGKSVTTHFVLNDHEETYTWDGPPNIDNSTFQPYEGKTRLRYHVVKLTWHLRFPSLPRAFVHELRRAPRLTSNTTANAQPNSRGQPRFRSQMSPLQSVYVAHAIPHSGMRRRRLAGPARAAMNLVRLPEMHEDSYRLMQRLDVEVQRVSRGLADRTEAAHRRRFEAWRGDVVAREWDARWKAERSLLKFID